MDSSLGTKQFTIQESTYNMLCLILLQSLRAEFRNKQFMWEFVKEIERPRIVNARVAPLTTKDNLYGQVVVRLHTQQVHLIL